MVLEHGQLATWYQLRGGKFQIIGQEPSGVVKSRALPGFVIDFGKFKEQKWLEIMGDIEESVAQTDVDKELQQEYSL